MLTRIARFGWVVVASVALLGAGTSAFAADDKPVSFGVNGDWASDDIGFGVGGRVIVNLDKQLKGLEAVGSFDYYFPSAGDELDGIDGVDVDLTYFEVNLNGIYKFKVESSSLQPYVGTGLNIARASGGASVDLGDLGDVDVSASETQVGLNLIGGVLIDKKFFVEAKYEAGGGEVFVVSAGLRF